MLEASEYVGDRNLAGVAATNLVGMDEAAFSSVVGPVFEYVIGRSLYSMFVTILPSRRSSCDVERLFIRTAFHVRGFVAFKSRGRVPPKTPAAECAPQFTLRKYLYFSIHFATNAFNAALGMPHNMHRRLL